MPDANHLGGFCRVYDFPMGKIIFLSGKNVFFFDIVYCLLDYFYSSSSLLFFPRPAG